MKNRRASSHKISVWYIVLFLLLAPSNVPAESPDAVSGDEVYIVKGELVTLKVESLTRLSLVDPAVADVVNAEQDEILLVGQQAGQTPLFIWDARGKRTVMVYVFNQDLELTKERLKKLLKAADIHEVVFEINEKESKIVASGDIPSYKKAYFDQIVAPFAGDIIGLVKEETIEDLIQIDMQITELSTTLAKSLGIEWFTGTQTMSDGQLTTTSGGGFSPTYGEIMPSLDGSVGDYFKIGDFQRSINSALIAQINALISQGKARVLSQPKLVVANGKEASFLVGGEIPIRTTTATGGGATQENVSFKSYGISMSITPEIKKQDKIDISLNVSVSDVDASNAVGNDVAFSTRTAQTKLYLNDGQTIVLAGLIKSYRSESLKKVPFLGDIPVVGLLFRSKSNPTSDLDQELVIALRPTILEKNRSGSQDKVNVPAAVKSSVSGSVSPAESPAVQRRAAPHYSGVPLEMGEYVRSVQEKIAQAVVYPREAEQYGWEGTVKLGLLILNDGTLATALVRESSGYEIFDEYALNIARDAAPYSSFPAGTDLKELNVTVPIVYSLERN